MMSFLKKNCTRQFDDGMDDDSDANDSKRKSRNLSEKKRRDQFNILVNDLNSLISTNSGRKMDKSTVLKATISFLKNHNEVTVRSRTHEIPENWKPSFLTNAEFIHLILEAVDGFFIVFRNTGDILYISQSITVLLGYTPDKVLGMTIYDLIYPEEHDDLFNLCNYSTTELERPVSFSCHVRRMHNDQRQDSIYELVHFMGYFGRNTEADSARYKVLPDDTNDTRLIFIGTGHLHVPHLINEIYLVDSDHKTEFVSRHSLEWKFLYLDHRAPPIIGYLPFELLGTSGYDYYHIDDLDRVLDCHYALMQKGDDISCSYRFLTKGQQWIWLKTKFYITYNQWNSKPEFIVCTHRAVSYVDQLNNTKKDDSINGYPADINISRYQHSSFSQVTTSNNGELNIPSNANQPNLVVATHIPTTPSTFTTPTQHMSEVLNRLPPAVIPTTPVISQIPMSQANGFNSTNHICPTLDLQRKHAELQALIGQQQAELRRVSEQLSMARLEMLAPSQNVTDHTTTSSYNTSAVSSTTSVLIPMLVDESTDQ